MTAVYALRHPQTTWNETERYQGRLEAPLSVTGKEQSRLTVRALVGRHLRVVYSSPLCRALDLARDIADSAGVPLIIDHRLTEIAMGPWEGLYKSQIAERFPEMFPEWYRRPDLVRFPHGETLIEVQQRSAAALDDVFRGHAAENVCVVTHSAVVQTIVASALGLELRYVHRVHVENASITTLSGERAPGSLASLNVTDHLDPARLAAQLAGLRAEDDGRRIAS
jgi:probable phosphoglycerate mutase